MKKFFDPAIFQKCWLAIFRASLPMPFPLGIGLAETRDSVPGRRPQTAKYPCAIILAHGEKGEKSDSFSRGSGQDRFPW